MLLSRLITLDDAYITLAHAVVVAFLLIGAVAVKRAGDRRGLTCLALVVAYIVYMASAGGDPPTAFPTWRQFVHVAPAWVLLAMTGLTSIVRDRRWRQVSAAVGLALAADLGVLLVPGTRRSATGHRSL